MPAEEETLGPWVVGDTSPSGRTSIYCYKTRRLESPTLAEAERMCAGLNAAERVRDASPALLAACEAASRIIEECDITWSPSEFGDVVEQIEAAIKAAKGTG